ncbi:MAG: hypothetical protein QOH93_2790 [Chloroflexia bacterium]|nr:hypothetical protein [Chloroflexia bacterium]
MKRVSSVLVLLLVLATWCTTAARAVDSQTGVVSWPAVWLADSAFFDLWAKSDGPVAIQAAGRSWLWGPVPFAVANEAYAESPTGKRLVEYLDKGRMEVNDPGADRVSNWFVTSGLLVTEMVSGRVQTGNGTLETRAPADVPVAGDAGSPNAPTYAAFSRLLATVPQATAGLATQVVARDGSVRPLIEAVPGASPRASTLGMYDEVSGHNIPAIFTEWAGQTGGVLQGGRLVQGQIMDPLYVLGRPITEAYWADVLVAGAPTRVLVQLFERRSITYNPANPPQWQVEMANVGRAYYDWRYGGAAPEPAISAEVTGDSLQLRGWNWPADTPVAIEIKLAGGTGTGTLAEPSVFAVQTAPGGTFGLLVPIGEELESALLAGANLSVVAHLGERQAALPLAARIPSGRRAVEGMLTSIVQGAGGYSLLVRDPSREEWMVSLSPGSLTSYSEGYQATGLHLSAGDFVRVEGTALGHRINASALRVMSLSRSGAQIGYEVQGSTIHLVGTNWPPSQTLVLSVRTFSGENRVQLGTGQVDSRGNVHASFAMPSLQTGEQPLWLFAQVVEKDSLLAQVAVLYPLDELAGGTAGVPGLIVAGSSDEQLGGLGNYCHGGKCAEALGVPVPGAPIPVGEGEVLALRSQLMSNPDLGPAPERFAAQLYAQPAEASIEGAVIGGTYYFSPQSLPIFSTGDAPGMPFSVPLPVTVPAGKYILLVNVVWPAREGEREEGTYGFVLDVGARGSP